MRKRAQGLPMQVVIIAVISLILLAVVVAIFIGKVGTFGKSVSDCEAKAEGAHCADSCRPGIEASVSGICPEEAGKFCCIPLETRT